MSASSSPAPRFSQAPTDVPMQYDDGSTGAPAPGSTLSLDQASRDDALARGEQVMRLFARRDVDAERWWTDLAPLLTPAAVQAYRFTDPRNVPPTKVTGDPALTPASTPLVARVSVPTDAGVYLVLLARTDQSPQWLADRIMPPEGSGDS